MDRAWSPRCSDSARRVLDPWSLDVQSAIGTELHAFTAQVALEGCLLIRVDENDVLRAYLYTFQAACALLRIDVVRALLILKYGPDRARLRTLPALGAGAHLEDAWIGKLGIYGET